MSHQDKMKQDDRYGRQAGKATADTGNPLRHSNRQQTEEQQRFALQKSLKYEKTLPCVQCGYCLPVCPTYLTMEKETHSPRGRIHLIRLAAEGKLTDLKQLQEPIDLCLGCRACETACPTGVEYGSILDGARQTLQQYRSRSGTVAALRKAAYRKVLPNPGLIGGLRRALWFYQRTGLQTLARKSGLLKTLPYHLGDFEAALPPVASSGPRGVTVRRRKRDHAISYRVAFFRGCVMDGIFRQINNWSVELLRLAGCEVAVVDDQTCCGALQMHGGEHGLACSLAKRNIAAFEREEFDFVVNSAGGCGAMMKEYPLLFENDAEWRDRARKLAEKTKDISEVLAMCQPLPWRREVRQTVTYQPSCHMTNVMKVERAPLELLRQIPGIELREMEQAGLCCGSAGIYNLVHYDESMAILDYKMERVKKTGASLVVATNPGCLLQMRLGIQREGLSYRLQAVHLVELLAEALIGPDS